ncbi:MAG: hypothetical protein GWN01_00390 [Nitrosopumilaceae archaeon]|nr:hypothetical protein [Nitrosopumilaceae archaeon]NIT99441.1 hypothetical protein [Nitrosopumilaceae archaeon]NIU85800.1 hypothetical protein [Nitrosopumilaceae archaeon]NIV64657.1 hypothetical protein [Nitrosopumilaceae archaeon]NIX60044.1 hypothetical protein [Nitrosopumilaceae archaeon]
MSAAFVLVNCDPNYQELVIKQIATMPEVTEAAPLYGAYECIVKVKNLKQNQIRKFVKDKIRKLNKVRSAFTLYLKDDLIGNFGYRTKKCPKCHSMDIIIDKNNGEKLCEECGFVVSERLSENAL